MKLAKKLKSNKGFTLVELVVVIAVLAILAGVGSVAYSGYITRAKEAADISNLAAIKTAVDSAFAKKGTVTGISVKVASNAVSEVKAVTGTDSLESAADLVEGTSEEAGIYNTLMTGNDKVTMSKNGTWTWKPGADGGWDFSAGT